MQMKWIGWSVPMLLLGLILVQPGTAENRLSLGDCIDIALKNLPTLRAARADLEAGKAREQQAVSRYFPQVTAGTGYSEVHQQGGALGDTITKSYTTSLSVNQTIYDFGRTGNAYDSACLNARAAELEMERVKQAAILKVKQAYFDLLQAQRLSLLAQKTLEQAETHLNQAQAFFRAGTKPIFDVTRAQVEVNNMRLNLITADNRTRISGMALNNAMGLEPEGPMEIDDCLAVSPDIPPLEKVKTAALGKRPELAKAETEIASAAARLRAEEAHYLPILALNGAYNWADGTTEMGRLQGDVENSWNAGISLSIPLYEGGLTIGKVSEAKAGRQLLEARRDTLRQGILIEVCQYYADMESAKVRIAVMEGALQKAAENFAIAQGRYEEGVGPYIDVTDAQVSSIRAETDYVQSLYDFQLAAARLMNAMGKGEQIQGTME